MGTNRKTKGIQSYLRKWGCYYPIDSGPSETKKGVLYGCSVLECTVVDSGYGGLMITLGDPKKWGFLFGGLSRNLTSIILPESFTRRENED